MTDITKIDDAETADTMGVDRFASAMKAKLDEKRMQGYEGWNNDCTVERLEKLMLKHVEKPWDARNLTDIANFCMMLWNRANPTATAARPEVGAMTAAIKVLEDAEELLPLAHEANIGVAWAIQTLYDHRKRLETSSPLAA